MLVGREYSVKVTDIAVFQPVYSHCYTTDAEHRIPLRWMPWEAVVMVSWRKPKENYFGQNFFSCGTFIGWYFRTRVRASVLQITYLNLHERIGV